MKKITATIFATVSFYAYASETIKVACLTHAQCQTYSEYSTGCFLVKTSANNCEKKCFEIETSSFCKFKPNSNYGYCKSESLDYKKPKLDDKDCEKAIELKEISHLI